MGSVRTTAALAADYPTTNASLQATIDKIDYQVQNGELAGAGLAQALGAANAVLDTYGETAAPPTAVYSGTAGPITRHYAAVIEYSLAIDNPPRPFPYRNVKAMPGNPIGGRGVFAADRAKRYSKVSAAVTVASTATTLNATNYVTVTAPAYSGAVTGATYSIVAVDASGNLLYNVASGVLPGGTAVDAGLITNSTSFLPPHAEFAVIPPFAASAVISVSTIGTSIAAGGLVSADVGGITASYAPVAADSAATVASGLAAAITAAQPLVGAVATGGNIAITAHATGSAGNLSVATSSSNATVALSSPFTLAGGTNGGPVYGPRTRVSGVAGVGGI